MRRLLLILLFWPLPVLAGAGEAGVGFGDYQRTEFSPARGQTFEIPVSVRQDAAVEARILTSDGDPVRSLSSPGVWKPGTHHLVWDGKDDAGQVVPDEAYLPVIRATLPDGSVEIVDPRKHSGGEVVEDLNVRITASKDIAYTLPGPSRVMIRAGVKNGPMLRSLAEWAPRGAGQNIHRWDGHDQNGLVDLRREKDLTVLVTAFRLPEHAILVFGNRALDYRAYRKEKGWPDRVVRREDMRLVREGKRISRHYYFPRSRDAIPVITLTLPKELARSKAGLPVVNNGQAVLIRVDIPPADRWLMNESLYEVGFFLDQAFLAEEEQGYVPIGFLWRPKGLSPGTHLLSVNISGFSGKVGVASLQFETPAGEPAGEQGTP